MLNDSRRALNFDYNVLDLLSEVRSGSTLKATYTWLADGTKLGVRDGSGANGFEYLGSLIYRKSGSGFELSEALFGDGVIRLNDNGTQEVNYFLTDHLGSVRVIVDASGTVKERNDYYPFGARHVRSDYAQSTNRWKYSGKEKQTTGDLDYLDYGARMYDAGLGRWMTVDPMAENRYSLSSYNYCVNNPLTYIDPDGQWDTHYVDKNYNMLLQTDDGSNDVVMVPRAYYSLFLQFASLYNSWNHISVFDSPGWNNHWKQEFGLADKQLTAAQLRVLDLYTSKWSRNAVVEYMLKPTFGRSFTSSLKEALSQWTNPEIVVPMLSLGIARWQGVAESMAKTGKSFFDGTRYTDNVLNKMKKGDFHGFPASVEAFESSGTITTIKGGDGILRQMLRIPGEYKGRKGFFEFIKEPDGSINHRFFNPK